jgi:hypothetical protein
MCSKAAARQSPSDQDTAWSLLCNLAELSPFTEENPDLWDGDKDETSDYPRVVHGFKSKALVWRTPGVMDVVDARLSSASSGHVEKGMRLLDSLAMVSGVAEDFLEELDGVLAWAEREDLELQTLALHVLAGTASTKEAAKEVANRGLAHMPWFMRAIRRDGGVGMAALHLLCNLCVDPDFARQVCADANWIRALLESTETKWYRDGFVNPALVFVPLLINCPDLGTNPDVISKLLILCGKKDSGSHYKACAALALAVFRASDASRNASIPLVDEEIHQALFTTFGRQTT